MTHSWQNSCCERHSYYERSTIVRDHPFSVAEKQKNVVKWPFFQIPIAMVKTAHCSHSPRYILAAVLPLVAWGTGVGWTLRGHSAVHLFHAVPVLRSNREGLCISLTYIIHSSCNFILKRCLPRDTKIPGKNLRHKCGQRGKGWTKWGSTAKAVQRLSTEPDNKQTYRPVQPREFVLFEFNELMFTNIKKACADHLNLPVSMCNVLVSNKGPSCTNINQIPHRKDKARNFEAQFLILDCFLSLIHHIVSFILWKRWIIR